jgi:hypothetical protein
VNYLHKVFGLSSIGLDRSRAFGSWSKYFAGISDSRGLGINRNENKNKNNRIIITIVFQLLFCCLFSYSITRSFLVILV